VTEKFPISISPPGARVTWIEPETEPGITNAVSELDDWLIGTADIPPMLTDCNAVKSGPVIVTRVPMAPLAGEKEKGMGMPGQYLPQSNVFTPLPQLKIVNRHIKNIPTGRAAFFLNDSNFTIVSSKCPLHSHTKL
jgi:hypothetical protein